MVGSIVSVDRPKGGTNITKKVLSCFVIVAEVPRNAGASGGTMPDRGRRGVRVCFWRCSA